MVVKDSALLPILAMFSRINAKLAYRKFFYQTTETEYQFCSEKYDERCRRLDEAIDFYEKRKSKNPDFLSFDNTTIKAFARRTVE